MSQPIPMSARSGPLRLTSSSNTQIINTRVTRRRTLNAQKTATTAANAARLLPTTHTTTAACPSRGTTATEDHHRVAQAEAEEVIATEASAGEATTTGEETGTPGGPRRRGNSATEVDTVEGTEEEEEEEGEGEATEGMEGGVVMAEVGEVTAAGEEAEVEQVEVAGPNSLSRKCDGWHERLINLRWLMCESCRVQPSQGA